MTEESVISEAEADRLPVDVETVRDSVDASLAMRLDTSTREQIDARTGFLIGHLSMLLAEDLRADQDETVRAHYRACYHLLDLSRRPTDKTPAYECFSFMRELAVRAEGLLSVYEKQGHTEK
ncbi:hypothetical protein [Streptomyces cellostaticus]|uniref:hypothetical protein n=1 Tax=Streptomyces cellostaticus TaxID=67285 RepID=UPI00099EEA3D|nr:hypothetical protein [Streptomyces cellostaticus]